MSNEHSFAYYLKLYKDKTGFEVSNKDLLHLKFHPEYGFSNITPYKQYNTVYIGPTSGNSKYWISYAEKIAMSIDATTVKGILLRNVYAWIRWFNASMLEEGNYNDTHYILCKDSIDRLILLEELSNGAHLATVFLYKKAPATLSDLIESEVKLND